MPYDCIKIWHWVVENNKSFEGINSVSLSTIGCVLQHNRAHMKEVYRAPFDCNSERFKDQWFRYAQVCIQADTFSADCIQYITTYYCQAALYLMYVSKSGGHTLYGIALSLALTHILNWNHGTTPEMHFCRWSWVQSDEEEKEKQEYNWQWAIVEVPIASMAVWHFVKTWVIMGSSTEMPPWDHITPNIFFNIWVVFSVSCLCISSRTMGRPVYVV